MWRVAGHGALRVTLAWPLAILLVIAVPMFLGWMHGLLVTRLNIQPFIVTLCGLLLYRGLARYIAGVARKDSAARRDSGF